MIKDIQNIINSVVNRERFETDRPVCRCGNKDLFNSFNSLKYSNFICDDCDIDVWVKR